IHPSRDSRQRGGIFRAKRFAALVGGNHFRSLCRHHLFIRPAPGKERHLSTDVILDGSYSTFAPIFFSFSCEYEYDCPLLRRGRRMARSIRQLGEFQCAKSCCWHSHAVYRSSWRGRFVPMTRMTSSGLSTKESRPRAVKRS